MSGTAEIKPKEGLEDMKSDGDGTDSTSNLTLSEYHGLSSRRVDLIGDYAGNELFLIEGDSLLLQSFDDDKLDLDIGCQILHATYNVEKILDHLSKRKCRFKLVFFQSNRLFCIPREAKNPSRFLLARAAIIRHLIVNSANTNNTIKVDLFDTWVSPTFLDYLQELSPYFIMAHDGATGFVQRSKVKHDDSDDHAANPNRVQLRLMILSFIQRGINVALINGLECRDTKVMALILETRERIPSTRIFSPAEEPGTTFVDASKEIKEVTTSFNLTERQTLAVIVGARILKKQPNLHSEFLNFLRHLAFVSKAPLGSRRIPMQKEMETISLPHRFLNDFSSTAEEILHHRSWHASMGSETVCDISDVLDGRIFLYLSTRDGLEMDGQTTVIFESLCKAAILLLPTLHCNIHRARYITLHPAPTESESESVCETDLRVLPFSHSVFDEHLELVRIDVDVTANEQHSPHQHIAKHAWAKGKTKPALTSKQEFWARRRDQRYKAEMHKYAASLTNSIGKSLEPELIVVGQERQSFGLFTSQNPSTSEDKKLPKKASGGKKTAQKNAAKQAREEKRLADGVKKVATVHDQHIEAWRKVVKRFEEEPDPLKRYLKAMDHLSTLTKSSLSIIGTECELYLIASLVQIWISKCMHSQRSRFMFLPALIWNHARKIAHYPDVPKTLVKHLERTLHALRLPSITIPAAKSDRQMSFDFPLAVKNTDLSIGISHLKFQLLEAGPFLERGFDSRPDRRVAFEPDGWQRKVLDSIDADHSVFVVAPTSAGKTFISFYAMQKILEADDDGVLVYVAPTKALVNQLAAEVQARFKKNYVHAGKSVWAIHTRDYKVNNPTSCQVLVTVPYILQIMLLDGNISETWSSKVKCIIFDEIHSIGQAEDGVVWEQLLLMTPCQIIALSATVGNPYEFAEWLGSTQEANRRKLDMVKHLHRYSDLRKYYHVPPKRFAFRGLSKQKMIGVLGLDGLPGLNHIHPVACLIDRTRGIPPDLSLEPADCFTLWQAMKEVETPTHAVNNKLSPELFLPDICQKMDVLAWEAKLKSVLQTWLEDKSSPYDDLLQVLEHGFRENEPESLYQSSRADKQCEDEDDVNANDRIQTTLPLLCRLHEQDALPAILFSYDRLQCENIGQALMEQLEHAENRQYKTGQGWDKKLRDWEAWKDSVAKAATKSSKESKGSKKQHDNEKISRDEKEREAAEGRVSKWASFDPQAPIDGYHFANYTKVQMCELKEYLEELRQRNVPDQLVDMLPRGIGIHHAGMNRKYRQVVEILFRKGFLRVVIATGTLALGINMPCKTVVFSGDSVFLTALNYRQCAGRAGRRGFDLLGNVVFQGIPKQKVCRLISSRLPDLNGHFPVTTTLVLRLFMLLHDSNHHESAIKSINTLLSQPRLYMGGPSFKDQTMHHLRFSIEYLRRQALLSSNGTPLNFANIISHLAYTENSSFAFHALLKAGYFHTLCSGATQKSDNSRKTLLNTLMLIMSHLFDRLPLPPASAEFRSRAKTSSSVVFLPPLPEPAAKILAEHDAQVLQIYTSYVSTFVSQHLSSSEDRALPLTGFVIGPPSSATHSTLPGCLPKTKLRSPFLALSGHGDEFESIHDLCSGVRSGVFLEEAVVPSSPHTAGETTAAAPANAYLLDFFKHGDVSALEKGNGIRGGDVWFLLNDFSVVLAAVVGGLKEFITGEKVGVMGLGESGEERKENEALKGEGDGGEPEGYDENEEDGAEETLLGDDGSGLLDVLAAFEMLQAEFNAKFEAMWS